MIDYRNSSKRVLFVFKSNLFLSGNYNNEFMYLISRYSITLLNSGYFKDYSLLVNIVKQRCIVA